MATALNQSAPTNSGPFTFDDIFTDERFSVHKRRHPDSQAKKDSFPEPQQLTALCLSGGGVRSASFCLGLVRALAEKGLLKHFDYLSTVSGGGFAGAFISRWVKESGFVEVEKTLKNDQAFSGDTPLNHLRRYISYLTPRLGLLSLDSLAGATLFVRNLFINWLALMPWIFVACLLPQFVDNLLHYFDNRGASHRIYLLAAAAGLLGQTYLSSLKSKPQYVGNDLLAKQQDPPFHKDFLLFRMPVFVILLFLLAMLGKIDLAAVFSGSFFKGDSVVDSCSNTNPSLLCEFAYNHIERILFGLAVVGLLYHLSRQLQHQLGLGADQTIWKKKTDIQFLGQVGLGLFALVFQVAAALVAMWIGGIALGQFSKTFAIQVAIVFLPLVLQLAFLISDAIYNAIKSNTPWTDIEQEWTGRLAGALLSLPTLWAVLAAVSLWGPLHIPSWLSSASSDSFTPVLNFGGATSLIGVLALVMTKLSSLYDKTIKGIDAWQAVGLRWGLWIVLSLFLLLVMLLFSELGHYLTNRFVPLLSTPLVNDPNSPLGNMTDRASFYSSRTFAILGMLTFSAVISMGTDRLSNLNKFSLHGIYRNRLVRAFVGASNPDRKDHKPGYLNMLRRDNVSVTYLAEPLAPDLMPPPIHVINMAMNIPGSRDESLQERKALPFTATPLSAGSSALLGQVGQYRSSERFASDVNFGGGTQPFSLGGAIAVSGAAFDPSMGRFGSAAMRMLLTLANVRLGVWLGNPGKSGDATFARKGPEVMIWQLAKEFLGLADETSPYIHLSDGGHFENLATYEMLRRRCRFILIVDAGCDPDYMFEDLGSLQRLARVDLNAQINLPADELAELRGGDRAFVIGFVTYRDQKNNIIDTGVVCYIKPSMQKHLQPEIDAYHRAKPSFPHETTLNQFFTESQFLAYMALGQKQGRALTTELDNLPLVQISGWSP
jgi:Patatin-like phospholipase